MNELFQLLDNSFQVSWDPETLTKDFPVFTAESYTIIQKSDGSAHWQYFKAHQIFFSRNFHLIYVKECQDIMSYLSGLQTRCRSEADRSKLLETFIHHDLHPTNITLVKVDPGSNVNLHYDRSRKSSINIGLKNSHAGITNVWDGEKVPEGDLIGPDNKKYSYQMRDGEAYILNTDQPHSVSCVPGNTSTRYIVSYSL